MYGVRKLQHLLFQIRFELCLISDTIRLLLPGSQKIIVERIILRTKHQDVRKPVLRNFLKLIGGINHRDSELVVIQALYSVGGDVAVGLVRATCDKLAIGILDQTGGKVGNRARRLKTDLTQASADNKLIYPMNRERADKRKKSFRANLLRQAILHGQHAEAR